MRIAYFRRIVKVGNSHAIVIPRDVRIMIGAKEGDWVRIEVSKYEPNLHDDNAARPSPEARDNGIHQEE